MFYQQIRGKRQLVAYRFTRVHRWWWMHLMSIQWLKLHHNSTADGLIHQQHLHDQFLPATEQLVKPSRPIGSSSVQTQSDINWPPTTSLVIIRLRFSSSPSIIITHDFNGPCNINSGTISNEAQLSSLMKRWYCILTADGRSRAWWRRGECY